MYKEWISYYGGPWYSCLFAKWFIIIIIIIILFFMGSALISHTENTPRIITRESDFLKGRTNHISL